MVTIVACAEAVEGATDCRKGGRLPVEMTGTTVTESRMMED